MRCICRNLAGSEAAHGQKGSDPVELRDLAELQAPKALGSDHRTFACNFQIERSYLVTLWRFPELHRFRGTLLWRHIYLYMANESAYKTGRPKIFISNLRNGRKMADAGCSPRVAFNISKDLRLPHQPCSCILIPIVTCYTYICHELIFSCQQQIFKTNRYI